jgi:hypothetical protein
MSNLASSEAGLDTASRTSGKRSVPIFAARLVFLLAILAIWQGAVATGLADAAFVVRPSSRS